MKILIADSYWTASHAHWAQGYRKHSRHDVRILKLPGRHWKWRMHGGAVTLAEMVLESGFQADAVIATDMVNLAEFLGLVRRSLPAVRTVLYFHENQFTYPKSRLDTDQLHHRDHHYGYINTVSALAADAVWFNSNYHLREFHKGLNAFLKQMPDHRLPESPSKISKKSTVRYLGFDSNSFDRFQTRDRLCRLPVICWNHRWEYDKNPLEFLQLLVRLKSDGFQFRTVLLGAQPGRTDSETDSLIRQLDREIIHRGFVRDRADYCRMLWQADLLPVVSTHDFFGLSVLEAIYCRTLALLPTRLSYPELYSEFPRNAQFYGDADELEIRLKSMLGNFDGTPPPDIRSKLARFSWVRTAAEYDQALIDL